MKNLKTSLGMILFFLLAIHSFSQEYKVRFAFIGNSITIGSFLTNPTVECYPSQLAVMLQEKYGDTCLITNFAVSGRTMLKHGDYPIWKELQFKWSINYAPDICYICLGTNDSKPYNWDKYGTEFLDDYMSMISTFKTRNPYTKFIVCYPPPAYAVVYDIRDSVILNGVIPMVDSVLKKTDAILVDYYHPLLDSVYLFPDSIHPNVKGAHVMAQILYDKIIETDVIHKVEKGLTFVTGLGSSKGLITNKDSIKLTWTTVNADTAYLDGMLVPVNGSKAVKPGITRNYTLWAKGKKSIDSLTIEQKVYTPEITNIRIDPKSAKTVEGDSIKLNLIYIDQLNKRIRDTVYNSDWSISDGNGSLLNQTDTAVTYIAGNSGTTTVLAQVGELSAESNITIEPTTNIDQTTLKNETNIFPNPFKNNLNILIAITNPTTLNIKLYDVKGTLCKEEHINISKPGKQKITLKTDNLAPGMYLYKIEYSGNSYSGKINKEGKM